MKKAQEAGIKTNVFRDFFMQAFADAQGRPLTEQAEREIVSFIELVI